MTESLSVGWDRVGVEHQRTSMEAQSIRKSTPRFQCQKGRRKERERNEEGRKEVRKKERKKEWKRKKGRRERG